MQRRAEGRGLEEEFNLNGSVEAEDGEPGHKWPTVVEKTMDGRRWTLKKVDKLGWRKKVLNKVAVVAGKDNKRTPEHDTRRKG